MCVDRWTCGDVFRRRDIRRCVEMCGDVWIDVEIYGDV